MGPESLSDGELFKEAYRRIKETPAKHRRGLNPFEAFFDAVESAVGGGIGLFAKGVAKLVDEILKRFPPRKKN